MENIDDIHEDTVRQMRLAAPASAQSLARPPRPRVSEQDQAQLARMRDLEELAMLSSEENERLVRELADVRAENDLLLRRVSMLEETIANPRRVLGLPDLPDEPESAAPRRGGAGGVFLTVLSLALVASAVGVLRPWQPVPSARWGMLGIGIRSEPRHRLLEAIEAARRLVGFSGHDASSTPARVEPAPTPVAAPVAVTAPAPVAAPIAVTAPAPVAAPAPTPVKQRPAKHRAHASKRPAADPESSSTPEATDSGEAIGGLEL